MQEVILDLLLQAVVNINKNHPAAPSITSDQIEITPTKNSMHGDYATNFALIYAKTYNTSPRALAQQIIEALPAHPAITKVEIAGPGFINFFQSQTTMQEVVREILQQQAKYGHSNLAHNKKILVEFVSANPTGPLHVGHGRHAAFGATLCNLLATIGYKVNSEYYVNDGGRQMRILALSVWLRYLEHYNIPINLPAQAYRGEYVIDVARGLAQQYERAFCLDLDRSFLANTNNLDDDAHVDMLVNKIEQLLGASFKIIYQFGLTAILADIREDLTEFGVHFDHWMSETAVIAGGGIQEVLSLLQNKNLLYTQDGATWFVASKFGDEKDRVLLRSDGRHTYVLPDMAYHLQKLQRGFDEIIDILGADHHGYVPRIRACLRAFDRNDEQFKVKLVQFVHLYRGQNKVQMSTRSGSFITLRQLRHEVGNDAARFFYVMRKVDQPMDFDIELAKSRNQDNPVYYVQYAHARIASIMHQAKVKNYVFDVETAMQDLAQLTATDELALLRLLQSYPAILQDSAMNLEPHRLVNYLCDLAGSFHHYYNSNVILTESIHVRNARLALCLAIKLILVNALTIIGVSAPEHM